MVDDIFEQGIKDLALEARKFLSEDAAARWLVSRIDGLAMGPEYWRLVQFRWARRAVEDARGDASHNN